MSALYRERLYLVFSDLDGSLLDHYSYSHTAALPALERLEQEKIPLILCSSKTRAEILGLKQQLQNVHPFIVENGAAVFIPQHYFSSQPPQTRGQDGFWVYDLSESRAYWLGLLNQLQEDFSGEFESFHGMGTVGIMAATGLSTQQAEQANAREYSEPVRWLGSDERKQGFIDRLKALGANVLQGGRFLSVSGEHDKGSALCWLRSVYQSASPAAVMHDLAIGDSGNDRAMLDAAETALLIRSPVHEFPTLARKSSGVLRSDAPGPRGWAEGVTAWLNQTES
ncbi:MAG: HAD-IIB family hydrolase [Halioglobus sp.]